MNSDVSDNAISPEIFCPLQSHPARRGLDLPTGRIAWQALINRLPQLSTRELEVLLLLGIGASNRRIATRLGVTERTVKAHVAQILTKLGVESRLQAGLVSVVFQLTSQKERELLVAPPRSGIEPKVN
ncbi:helix-turn-helix domain-containing protein [Allokutzneria albata]|uniref:Regulatory protein, luxR family n=1 Tax=Allokutzneria albata TaxID=211114 RepID=A0A1G9S693_ALLAB|nr:helix-turn-helix transcriptional regulator [Allokutzneria albata]SDM31029.1 regulatory protein, luxR family [Allokutzneria albata]